MLVNYFEQIPRPTQIGKTIKVGLKISSLNGNHFYNHVLIWTFASFSKIYIYPPPNAFQKWRGGFRRLVVWAKHSVSMHGWNQLQIRGVGVRWGLARKEFEGGTLSVYCCAAWKNYSKPNDGFIPCANIIKLTKSLLKLFTLGVVTIVGIQMKKPREGLIHWCTGIGGIRMISSEPILIRLS